MADDTLAAALALRWRAVTCARRLADNTSDVVSLTGAVLMRQSYFAAVCLTALLSTSTWCRAGQVENMMSFQARLTDNGGNPLSNGPHTLDFFFYGQDTGGAIIGSILNVQVTLSGGNGVVSQPIGPVQEAWFADAPRFMGITIDDNDDNPVGNELAPRIRLTTAPFAMRAGNLQTSTHLSVASASIAGQLEVGGRLGLGGATPQFGQLQIHAPTPDASNGVAWLQEESSTSGRIYLKPDGLGDYNWHLTRAGSDSKGITIDPSGKVFVMDHAILSANANGGRLALAAATLAANPEQVELFLDSTGTGIVRVTGPGGYRIDMAGNGVLRAFDSDGSESIKLQGQTGTTVTRTLQITGGSDLAEPFRITQSHRDKDWRQPGMVMVIDPDNPGGLMPATEPYDKRVAGVISGANGLSPGMIMKAEGQPHADGEHPVALTGRVWCWCDASPETGSGPIEPGDMLTTSATPGHAMKVSDFNRAHGSVIGKAMTRLESGNGLVLVLANLQ